MNVGGGVVASELYQRIGEQIRRARESLHLSQEELARQLGFNSPGTISFYESGERRISIADLQRVASILGLPLSFFLEDAAPRANRIRLRAQEVRPASRHVLEAFLTFVEKHGSTEPVQLIAGSAGRPWQLAEAVLSSVGIAKPPVSPRLVAERLGVPVFDWELPDEISGVFVQENGRIAIGVNAHHPSVRQHFTIAHELGHCLHKAGRSVFVDFTLIEAAPWAEDTEHRKEEARANQFAAALLMPRTWIVGDVKDLGVDLALLAKRYGVSEQALWLRLLNLRLVNEASED